MLSWLFRSKASLERALAVEQCRREHAEEQLLALSARLQDLEAVHQRLIDECLARAGAISAPLRPRHSRGHGSPSPMAQAFAALQRDTLTTPTPDAEASRER